MARRVNGPLDFLTRWQRELVMAAYEAEWPRFRGDQWPSATVNSLKKEGVIREVGSGFYELSPSFRSALKTQIKKERFL